MRGSAFVHVKSFVTIARLGSYSAAARMLSDIVAGRFDAGIRLGEHLQKDMVALRLGGQREAMVVGAPSLVERLGRPRRPEDLHEFPCVRFRWPGRGDIYRWEFEKGGKSVEIDVDGPFIANDTAMMVAAAREGLGLAYVLDTEARPLVEAGALVRVLPDWTPPFEGFHLYHPRTRQMRRPLEAFIEFLTRRTAEL